MKKAQPSASWMLCSGIAQDLGLRQLQQEGRQLFGHRAAETSRKRLSLCTFGVL